MYPLDTNALKICAYGVEGLEQFEKNGAEKTAGYLRIAVQTQGIVRKKIHLRHDAHSQREMNQTIERQGEKKHAGVEGFMRPGRLEKNQKDNRRESQGSEERPTADSSKAGVVAKNQCEHLPYRECCRTPGRRLAYQEDPEVSAGFVGKQTDYKVVKGCGYEIEKQEGKFGSQTKVKQPRRCISGGGCLRNEKIVRR